MWRNFDRSGQRSLSVINDEGSKVTFCPDCIYPLHQNDKFIECLTAYLLHHTIVHPHEEVHSVDLTVHSS